MKKQHHSQTSKKTSKTIYKKSFTKDNVPIDVKVIDDKNAPFFNFKLKDDYEIRKKDGI